MTDEQAAAGWGADQVPAGVPDEPAGVPEENDNPSELSAEEAGALLDEIEAELTAIGRAIERITDSEPERPVEPPETELPPD